MLAGTDISQLTVREMQAVPFEYIRQVCMLPPETEQSSTTATGGAEEANEYGQEAVVAEN